jgi:asparagine N-glycosylation enzyme membrane subunit Stt3
MRAGALLVAILALAFGLRALGVERVLPESGDVVFAFGDPYYHLRLALYSLTRFPEFLQFDSYLHHPVGSHVPWPPLYDWWVAGSALLLGGGVRRLELVAAWWPPIFGTLTTLAVYAAGRATAGRSCGLAAALIHALLPASAVVSRVGYADHHAAVACLGAAWLALQLSSLRRTHLALAAGLAAARGALVLTWSGSLAYLGVAEVGFVLVALLGGKRRALAFEAGSLAVSALLLAPLASITEGQLGGPFSTLEFSWLHVTACAALGAWAAACVGILRTGAGGGGPVRRALLGAVAGGLLLIVVLVIPGVLAGLEAALAFLGRGDIWGTANPEQVPLFSRAGFGSWAWYLFGALGFALPVAPLLLLGLAATRRDTALALLGVWTAGFGALALAQVRFANDLAPSLSVTSAALLLEALGWLALRRPAFERFVPVSATLCIVALLSPTILLHHRPGLEQTLAWRGATSDAPSPEGTFLEFAKQVRSVTPETAGFLEPSEPAEYGILADPSLGHVLHYVAHRATPADNFGPYVGREGFEATLRLLLSPPADTTLDELRDLGIRYVVTGWQPRWHPGSLLQRLHTRDGRAQADQPTLAHFRLIAEGPPRGVPLGAVPGSRSVPVPYKLFEVVEGARLRVGIGPGERVTARVTVSGSGRRFVHRVDAVADDTGCATLRLPYATSTDAPVRPEGPYRLDLESGEIRVELSELDVQEGRLITLPVATSESGDGGPAC